MARREPEFRSLKKILEAAWQDKKVRSACGPTRWRNDPSGYCLFEQLDAGVYFTPTTRINQHVKSKLMKLKRQIKNANRTTDN